MKECSQDKCNRDVFKDRDKCILHCEKGSYLEDIDNEVLESFYYALVDYIAQGNFIKGEWISYSDAVGFEALKKHLIEGNGSKEVISFCAANSFAFVDIYFPKYREINDYNYLKILRKIKGSCFDSCKFNATSIDYSDNGMFFNKCEFLSSWKITSSKLLEHQSVLFKECTFTEDVISSSNINLITNKLGVAFFNNCIFKKDLSFRDVKIKSRVFNNTDTDFLKISKLTIENCEIDEKFILNKSKINSLLIKDSIFKSKVELKDNEIDEIKIINTNFKGLFDSLDTKYRKFYCSKSTYSDFVGFEDCKFSEMATFEYVTFLSFTNFRNATFNQGLDLQTTNLKESPNFLNIDIDIDVLSGNTNRETLRIIKDSFDKIGNHIEANKFFGREMCKYKEELADKPFYNQEKIIFWLNKGISNFGQSYLRPIFWICVFSAFYALLIYGYEYNWLYGILPMENEVIGCIVGILNGFASNLIPFKSILKEGMEFVSLIFYIIFASLIWQTVVAVKRHTRR